MDERYKLCYVRYPWAYFTTQELAQQWGDDWDDAPYEHNAGQPYEWLERIYRNGHYEPNPEPRWEIDHVAVEGNFDEPCGWTGNSPYCVRDINAAVVPWLRMDRWEKDGPPVLIWAGTTYPEFVRLVQDAGGAIYERREGA